jgi:septal ring factor EnvC (AmiA/AmiB activator)
VKALAPAKVAWSGWLGGYGNLVVLDQGDGYHTIYAHLAEVLRPVERRSSPARWWGRWGDRLAQGAYLYFEVRRRGLAVDPMPWVGAAMARAP